MAGIECLEPAWPETCRYFDPALMDAEYARKLLSVDTEYSEEAKGQQRSLEYVSFSRDGAARCQKLALGAEVPNGASLVEDPNSIISAFFLFQKRRYYKDSTTSEIRTTPETWLHLLDGLMVPSMALEVLHDNNGGHGSLVSKCSTGGVHGCPDRRSPFCAYHVWVKVGGCNNLEHFTYARHDFHTGRGLLLVLGTAGAMFIRRLTTQFRGQNRVNIFHVLLALQSSYACLIEDYRWRRDYAVQDVESKTGYSSLTFPDIEPLSPEQLTLSRDIIRISNSLQSLVSSSVTERSTFGFLSSQLNRFSELCQSFPDQTMSAQTLENLCDALAQYHSQTDARVSQIQALKLRIDAQWNVVNALIAQRDSQVNINIAAATKADSELMRGIAVATLFFLPGTFLGTFFSMVFFSVDSSPGGGRLLVSKWIWLFPACAVPLTVVLALNYGLMTGLPVTLRIFKKR